MARARTVVCALSLMFLGACASLDHRPLDPKTKNEGDHGIRYYEMSPYLIVYSDTNGNVVSKIEYLPDQTRLMSVTPSNFLAKLESELVFENGTLKSSTATVDETTLAKAAITAAKAVATGSVGPANEPDARFLDYPYPAPHVFKIVVQKGEIVFYGAKGDCDIHVSLTEPKDPPKKDDGAKKTEGGSGQ